jgi:hypothetical protein
MEKNNICMYPRAEAMQRLGWALAQVKNLSRFFD